MNEKSTGNAFALFYDILINPEMTLRSQKIFDDFTSQPMSINITRQAGERLFCCPRAGTSDEL